MTKSIHYGSGRDVQLEAFGVVRPTPVDTRESLALSGGLDRLAALAGQREQSQQVADYAEQGSQAALKRDESGNLAPLELYQNDTAAGRAFNQAAITAQSAAIAVDADVYAREMAQGIKNNRETAPDGTPGSRISKDMVGDWDKSWNAYVEKTIGRLPDVLRANVEGRLKVRGAEYRAGLAETQQDELQKTEFETSKTSASQLARDAVVAATQRDGAKSEAALKDFLAVHEAAAVRAGVKIDQAAWQAYRQTVLDNVKTATVYGEAFDLYKTENAKGRNMESTAFAKAVDWIDKQGLTPEMTNHLRSMIQVRAEMDQSIRQEAESKVAENFYKNTPALLLDMAERARVSLTDAYAHASEQARKAVLPAEQAWWVNQASGYASQIGGEKTAAQVHLENSTVQRIVTSPDPIKDWLEADSSGFLGQGADRKANNDRIGQLLNDRIVKMSRIETAQRENARVLSAWVGTPTTPAEKNTAVDQQTLNSKLNERIEGFDDGTGQKIGGAKAHLINNPGDFDRIATTFKFVPSIMKDQVMSWAMNGSGNPLKDVEAARRVATLLDFNSDINLGQFSLEERSVARQIANDIVRATANYLPADNATPEAKQSAMEKIGREVTRVFENAKTIKIDKPEVTRQIVDMNLRETIRAQAFAGLPKLDPGMEFQPGASEATLEKAARAAVIESTGTVIYGNFRVNAGSAYQNTTRWFTLGTKEVDMFELANKIFSPLDWLIEGAGDEVKAIFGTKSAGLDAVDFWNRIFTGQNVVVSPDALSAGKSAVISSMIPTNVAPSERASSAVRRVEAEWGVTQFSRAARDGLGSVVHMPLERTAGGIGPSQALVAAHLEANKDMLLPFKGGHVDPRVAVMRAGDVNVFYGGTYPAESGGANHVYRVFAVDADGLPYRLPDLKFPTDFADRVEQARRNGMQEKATELRKYRQGGGFSSIRSPEEVLRSGTQPTNPEGTENYAISRAGAIAARKEIQRLQLNLSNGAMESVRYPANAERVPYPEAKP